MQQTWRTLEPYVDEERFGKTRSYLEIQHKEALWWRDACLAYFIFMGINKLPLPAGARQPEHPLDYYKELSFPFAPGRGR